ncbi:hypothetical protein BVX98_01430, partial [bacterium F11]
MRYTTLSGFQGPLSQIGLGTWPFADDAWGKIDEKTCLDTIFAALDAGINVIDTAPFYGLGRVEEIVGKALKGRRDNVFLATKFGLIKEGKSIKKNSRPESIRTELEASLKRLGTETIDLYQIHWPDPKTPFEETLEETSKFFAEGKIKSLGVCNFDLDLLKKIRGLSPIATLQNQYSLLKPQDENHILPYCHAEKMGYLAYGSLGGG